MRNFPDFESLEDRRLMSVALESIHATSLVPGTPSGTLVRDAKARLTAQGFSEMSIDHVTSVTYFIDRNDDHRHDKGDLKLGQSSDPENNFAVDALIRRGTPLGLLTISAFATGAFGRTDVSDEVTNTFKVVDPPPRIKEITASSKMTSTGPKLILDARGVMDRDGDVTKVDFFLDRNHNGRIDAHDRNLGRGRHMPDTQIWTFNASKLIKNTLAGKKLTFLAQATNDSGVRSSASSPPRVTATAV